ncbi:MAG: hypothetical protein ACLPPF_22395 [Rhodomicrobium sp.]
MEQAGLHQGLELRLEVLKDRMRTLAEKMSRAEGVQKIDNLGDLDRLERRYDELNREGPGFRHELKNELEKLSADLSGTLDDFIMWTDSGYRPDKRPAPSSK